jgi:hypothetical protein
VKKNIKEAFIMAKALDLTNQKFGKLVAIQRAPKRNDRYTRWIC